MLTIITGPMFAGKSTELIDIVRRLCLDPSNRIDVVIPSIDSRSRGAVRAHAEGKWLMAREVARPIDILLELKSGATHLAIDEVQLFDHSVVSVLTSPALDDVTVYAAGLNLTSEGLPFGPMRELMCCADHVQILSSRCACGASARRTLCKTPKTSDVLIGGSDMYEPACLKCWRRWQR